MRHLTAIAFFFVASVSLHASTVLDNNFTETTFVGSGLSSITGMAWATDGSNKLFVAQKGGVIRLVKDGQLATTPFATLTPVFTNSECGLIGICVDPSYATTKHVYAFVTRSNSEQQLIRLTDTNDVGTNETLIKGGLPTAGNNHDGGGIAIGPDGKLYWAIGDLGNGTGVDNDFTSLAAKVGRCNLDGSAPTDNPFRDGSGSARDFIFARGMRNPFTITFQPATGKLWVNSVGDGYEQIFLVESGNHAGYNDFENNQPDGFITPRVKYRTNGTDTRTIAASGAVRAGNVITITTSSAHGFRKGERITLSGITDTSFNGNVFVASTPTATTFTASQSGADATSGSGQAQTQNIGGSLTGGTFYDGATFPAEYTGNFFFGDFNSDRVMRVVFDSTDNSVVSVTEFLTGVNQSIDITVGPDGALYYCEFGGTIYRLASNTPRNGIATFPSALNFNEAASGTFNVWLGAAPSANVTLNVAVTSGDADVTVTGGAALQFTTANFATPQTVTVGAADDADTFNDTATVTVSGTGFDSRTISVSVTDNDTSPVAGQDSDSDGVTDTNEVTDGTNPLDATSFTTTPFTVSKLTGGVKFGLTAKDKVSVSGVIPALPAGYDPLEKTVLVDVAGATSTFALTDKAAQKKDDKSAISIKLKPSQRNKATKKNEFLGGDVTFKVNLAGTFASAWANEGVAAGIKDKTALSFVVDLAINGRRYRATVPVEFKSSDKSGSIKRAKQ